MSRTPLFRRPIYGSCRRMATFSALSPADCRLTLQPHELAFLLGTPPREIALQIQRGDLPNASRVARALVGFEDALALIRERVSAGECSPLAELLAAEMRRGRLRVSREEAGWLTHEAAFARCRGTPPSNP